MARSVSASAGMRVRRRRGDRLVDAHHAVDDRILAVQAQMDEAGRAADALMMVQFYSLPLADPDDSPLLPIRVAPSTLVALRCCARCSPLARRCRRQLSRRLQPLRRAGAAAPSRAAPAQPQAPPTVESESAAPTSICRAFRSPYRQGYADGCASAGGAEHKDAARFKSDGQYRTGWQDGNALCKK